MIASFLAAVIVEMPGSALPLGLGLHGIFLAWIGWWLGWFGWLYIRYRQNTWRTRLRTVDAGP